MKKDKKLNFNRTVIISGGEITNYEYIKQLIKKTDYIICADSGYDHALKMDITPDLVVGDFDSSITMPPENIKITFPPKKNLTDTEISLNIAREYGFNNFLLLACLGSRLDHTLANIFLLKSSIKHNETMCIANEYNKIFITNSKIELNIMKGQLVSLLPLENCTGKTTYNLEYPLNNADLPMGTTIGISNVAIKENICISVNSGHLLIILAND